MTPLLCTFTCHYYYFVTDRYSNRTPWDRVMNMIQVFDFFGLLYCPLCLTFLNDSVTCPVVTCPLPLNLVFILASCSLTTRRTTTERDAGTYGLYAAAAAADNNNNGNLYTEFH